VAIGNNPGGDTLSGDKSNLTGTGTLAGIATFNSLSIAHAGEGYTLTAAMAGVTGTESAAFNVTPRAAKLLVFTVQPTAASAGATITPAVQVTAETARQHGDELRRHCDRGDRHQSWWRRAVGHDEPIRRERRGHLRRLEHRQGGGGLHSDGSGDRADGSHQQWLHHLGGRGDEARAHDQPSSSAQSGVALAQQPVIQLRDASGNPVSQAGVTVTAAIATGGGTLGGALTATTIGTGAATFTNLEITGTAGDRTLSFSATGLTGVTSATITITAGAATQLTVRPSRRAPRRVACPSRQQPVIQVRDASGTR